MVATYRSTLIIQHYKTISTHAIMIAVKLWVTPWVVSTVYWNWTRNINLYTCILRSMKENCNPTICRRWLFAGSVQQLWWEMWSSLWAVTPAQQWLATGAKTVCLAGCLPSWLESYIQSLPAREWCIVCGPSLYRKSGKTSIALLECECLPE